MTSGSGIYIINWPTLRYNSPKKITNLTEIFDRTTGTCSKSSNRQRCFAEESPIDNSKIVVRLGQRDWLSHDLMRTVAGLLLSEKLGYSVRNVDVSGTVAKDPWQPKSHVACDFTLHSWLSCSVICSDEGAKMNLKIHPC